MEYGTRCHDTVTNFTSKCDIELPCILIISIVEHFRVAIIPKLSYGCCMVIEIPFHCSHAVSSFNPHTSLCLCTSTISQLKRNWIGLKICCDKMGFGVVCCSINIMAQHEMRHGGQPQCDGEFSIVIVTIQRRIKCNRVIWVRSVESGIGIMATQTKDGAAKSRCTNCNSSILGSQLTLSWAGMRTIAHRKYRDFYQKAFAIRIVLLNANIACAVDDITKKRVKWRTRAQMKCEMVFHGERERPETLIIFTRLIPVNPFFRVSSLLISFQPNCYTIHELTDECRMSMVKLHLG